MTTSTTQLRQHILGMEPYVLLTFGAADNGADVTIEMEYGGGVDGTSDVRVALLLALSQMGTVSDEEIEMLRETQTGAEESP